MGHLQNLESVSLKLQVVNVQQPCGYTGLVALPAELVTEVIKGLEWKDILRLRQTCRYLHGATTAKPVWTNLFSRYSAKFPASILSLERPMDYYTSDELERLVLRYESARVGWKTSLKAPESVRRRTRHFSLFDTIYLVEGGRWLLTVSEHGSISYYDLDSGDSLVGKKLTPEQADIPLRPYLFVQYELKIDVQRDINLLTFNLALCRLPSESGSSISFLIEIWHVTLELNSQGCGFGLSARRLSSFYLERGYYLSPISLNGPAFAYEVGGHYVVVVDWADAQLHYDSQADSLSYKKRIIRLQHALTKFRLLPQNLLVAFHCRDIQLYDLLSIPESTNIPSLGLPQNFTQYMWRSQEHSGGILPGWVSEPFFCPLTCSVRLVFRTSRGPVRGLIIPCHDPIDTGPRIVTLTNEVWKNDEVAWGFYSGVSLGSKPHLQLIQYSWPDNFLVDDPPDSQVLEFSEEDEEERFIDQPNIWFDEGSGRMLVVSRVSDIKVTLFDFAMI